MFDIVQGYFSIELMGAAILAAIRFPLRENRKYMLFPLFVFLFLGSAYKIGGKTIIDYGFLGGWLYYLAVLFFVILVIWHCFQIAYAESVILGVAAFAMQHCANDFVILVLGMMRLHLGEIVLTPRYALIRFSVMGVVYLGLYFCLIRNLQLDKKNIQNKRGWISLVVVIFFLVTALYGLFEPEEETIFWYEMHIYDAICTVFSMIILVYLSRSDALQQEIKTIRQMWKLKQEYYELSKENMQLINIKCHDIRKHIAHLYAAPQQEGAERDFLEEVEKSIRIYDSISKTGNDSLDVILTEKSLFCEKNHIRLTCMADGKGLQFMEKIDLYSLFGNILDNAIESVQKLEEEEKKVIDLDVRTSRNFLRIQEENYYKGELQFEDGLPVTTKPDRDYHGFGMKSIRMLVDQYGGEMKILAEEGIFSLNILIPVEQE